MIPNVLLAGAYPTIENLNFMKELGIDVIVCLLTEEDLNFIGNYHLTLDIEKYFKFIHCPIEGFFVNYFLTQPWIDFCILENDNDLIKLVDEIINLIEKDKKVFMWEFCISK